MRRSLLVSRSRCSRFPHPRPTLQTPSRSRRTRRPLRALYEGRPQQEDFEEASKYLGSKYIQHNPVAADGPDGLKAFIGFLKEKFPHNRGVRSNASSRTETT